MTVRELVDAFLEQYQGAPATKDWLRYYLIKSTDAFGEESIGSLGALANGCRRSTRLAWNTGASTTCGTRSRHGAWLPA